MRDKPVDSAAEDDAYNYHALQSRQPHDGQVGWSVRGRSRPRFHRNPRMDGTEVGLSDYRGKPVVLEMGSVTFGRATTGDE